MLIICQLFLVNRQWSIVNGRVCRHPVVPWVTQITFGCWGYPSIQNLFKLPNRTSWVPAYQAFGLSREFHSGRKGARCQNGKTILPRRAVNLWLGCPPSLHARVSRCNACPSFCIGKTVQCARSCYTNQGASWRHFLAWKTHRANSPWCFAWISTPWIICRIWQSRPIDGSRI